MGTAQHLDSIFLLSLINTISVSLSIYYSCKTLKIWYLGRIPPKTSEKSLLSSGIVLSHFLSLSHLQAIRMKKTFVSKAWLTKAHLFPNTTAPWCCLQQGQPRAGLVQQPQWRCYRASHPCAGTPCPPGGQCQSPSTQGRNVGFANTDPNLGCRTDPLDTHVHHSPFISVLL